MRFALLFLVDVESSIFYCIINEIEGVIAKEKLKRKRKII